MQYGSQKDIQSGRLIEEESKCRVLDLNGDTSNGKEGISSDLTLWNQNQPAGPTVGYVICFTRLLRGNSVYCHKYEMTTAPTRPATFTKGRAT